MMYPVTKRAAAAALAAAGCCAPALATSIGPTTGNVWVGRTLNIVVPVTFDDIADDCLQAEVSYGETRLPAAKVHLTALSAGERRDVRLETSATVNEPLVAVSLRAGCGSPVTRAFTLLADLPTEEVIAASNQPADAPLAASLPPAVRATAEPAPPVPAMRRAAAPRSVKKARPQPTVQKRPVQRAKATTPVHAQPAPAIDRASQEAVIAAATSVENALAKMRVLHAELADLKQAATRSQAEVSALRQELEQTRTWYRAPALTLVLALLAAASTSIAGLLLARGRRKVRHLDLELDA